MFAPDTGDPVTDPELLRQLHGYTLDERATDYIGGTEVEDAVAAATERSGVMWFEYGDGDLLRVVMEYTLRRPLSQDELDWLTQYTLGQWSDGMGECVYVEQGALKDYKLQPLGFEEVEARPYPTLQWIDQHGRGCAGRRFL